MYESSVFVGTSYFIALALALVIASALSIFHIFVSNVAEVFPITSDMYSSYSKRHRLASNHIKSVAHDMTFS